MKSYFRYILLPLISAAISSCATLGGGEPAATDDATPPPDYQPVFINRTAPMTDPVSNGNPKPTVQISRVETGDMRKIRMYVHVVDSSGIYYTGAASGKYKKMWCLVQEDLDGQVTDVKNYTLKEVTENDRDPYAMALVMDHSGSMGESRAHVVQDAAEALINKKKNEDALAIVKYDSKVSVECPLTSNRETLLSKLQKNGLTGYGGGTAILDGSLRGVQEVQSAAGYRRKAVIMFSDGRDNSSQVAKDSLVNAARNSGVVICAVAFGDNVNQNLLEDVSGATGGTYHHIYSRAEFDKVFQDVYKRLRNYYVIEYTPINYGVHTIKLKLCTGKDSAMATAQYDNTPDIGNIVLLNVFFDYNKAEVKPESKPGLENVAALMRGFPNMRIEVRGHTDNQNSTKDPDFNKKLSGRRADAVKAELVRMGVSSDRITTSGLGDTVPLADNATEEGRAQNRRTEFVVVSR